MNSRLSNFLNHVTAVPVELHELLEHANQGDVKVNHGDVRVRLEAHAFQAFIQLFERITNRIAFAIVLSAIVMASAIVVRSDISFLGLRIGYIGFVMASVLGFWLLLSIMRHGKI
jgi:ubiquinone biosynthesis protein